MDGFVMGGGMGIAQGASLRIVSSHSKIAMPETAIGLFPDVGATHFMAKMPVELSLYLGISGVTVNFADALFAGLADSFIERDRLSDMEELLSSIVWRQDPLTDLQNSLKDECYFDADGPSLNILMPAIQRHFDPTRSVAHVVESLDAERDFRYREWARSTAETLRSRSPVMMCVTREQLVTGRTMTLADSFRRELGMVHRTFEEGDFIEGIRAMIIDKDKAPRWRAATLDEVTPLMVSRLFDSPWSTVEHPLRDLN
jgi:enoyl-CoA hydratase/carnithine racemase